jgi:hypothetical protein
VHKQFELRFASERDECLTEIKLVGVFSSWVMHALRKCVEPYLI